MRVAVPRETAPDESRVALVPETVAKLVKSGLEVAVESGAGGRATFSDEAYRQAGAAIVPTARELLAQADVVVKVREPIPGAEGGPHEADLIRQGAVLIAFLGRDPESDAARRLASRRVTAFSMEMIPRISRAQKMDALSSMSTVAGYKAVLMGAANLGKFFPLLMTAAGTIAPARVFVLGAGVAGLQAIATARRLGAVVEAFDVRPAVREEVQSLGATFVGHELLDQAAVAAGGYAKEMTPEQQARQRQLVADRLKQSDVVVSTAMVPGKKAPILIPEATVREMRAGSVIVVPGYGLAVAQAQHAVRELMDQLSEEGVDVKFAIHPVAGRMPGHMDVLLAESDIPYADLVEMDEVNPDMPQCDVALVIGANDVTNPAARDDPASPIYGMPILDVDKAASIVVMKRSMNPGFAGIDNELYLDPKTTMLFGDAKDSVLKLISAVKTL